jgi:mRNA-degrading endonuclease RelE of RelBE toxin-antitoxin system
LSDQNLYQIEVEMGDLKEVGKELAKVLEERLKTHVEMNESRLVLREGSSRHIHLKDVKMQVKHALHHLGFSSGYRVLSEHSTIRIFRVEKKRRHVKREGLAPSPSQSLPYLFPT